MFYFRSIIIGLQEHFKTLLNQTEVVIFKGKDACH